MTPTLILTADWHLRGDVPKARIDKETYLHVQAAKRDFVLALALRLEIPIVIAGDVGNKPEWPNWLLTSFINVVAANKAVRIHAIPGQHDLPEHRLDQWHNSGLGVLCASGAIEVLVEPLNNVILNGIQIDTAPYGAKPPEWDGGVDDRNVLVCHTLLSNIQDDPNGGEYADSFMRRHSMYDLILVGDNHKTFAKKYRDTLLLSPVSLMRMSADQVEHRPAVFLWYAETNQVRPMYLPLVEDVLTRDHIDLPKEKAERLAAFTERMKGTGEVKLSFEKNVERGMNEQNVRDGVRRKVNKALKED